MNPLAKRTFLGYSLTFLGFAIIFMGLINPLFFYVIPFKGYTMQHEMQHGNLYKIFLYFGARLTKYLYLPTLSQIIPKSSQLKRVIISFLVPGSPDISDAFGHFRTFSDIFAAKHATITQLIRNSDTLTSYKQVKKSSVYASLQKYWRVLASILLVKCHILSILADICQNLSKNVLICVFSINSVPNHPNIIPN